MEEFRNDPEKNPLPTPSGKIEIFSETLASFNYKDCLGHPSWIEQDEWLGSKLVKKFPCNLFLANQIIDCIANLTMDQKVKRIKY